MKNTKLVPKHQIGKKILKFFADIGNAQIAGDSGAGAAAAAASGYKYNRKTRKWEQSKENLKEAEELRNNLAVLSTSSPTHPGTAFIEKAVIPGVISVGSKGLPYVKQILKSPKIKSPKIKSSTNSSFPPDDLFADDLFAEEQFLKPLGEAPYPEQVKPYQTYKPVNLDKFNRVKSIKLQKPTYQSSGNRAWVDYGEYDNPLWKEFYEDILKPLNKRSRIPARKPRLVNFSDQSPKHNGVFFVGEDVSLVDINGNRNVGLHEYISHGTDQFANPKQWEFTYYTKTNPIKNNVIKESTNWYEQRATFNEGRFNLYLKLREQMGKRPTLGEFQKYIDSLSDDKLLNSTLFINNKSPFNGYANDYYNHIKGAKDVNNTTKKLRHNMKYIFGLTSLPILNNE